MPPVGDTADFLSVTLTVTCIVCVYTQFRWSHTIAASLKLHGAAVRGRRYVEASLVLY
jgi:hypothetical protein